MRSTLTADHFESALSDLEQAIQRSQVAVELAARGQHNPHTEEAAKSLDQASVALARLLHLIYGPALKIAPRTVPSESESAV